MHLVLAWSMIWAEEEALPMNLNSHPAQTNTCDADAVPHLDSDECTTRTCNDASLPTKNTRMLRTFEHVVAFSTRMNIY